MPISCQVPSFVLFVRFVVSLGEDLGREKPLYLGLGFVQHAGATGG